MVFSHVYTKQYAVYIDLNSHWNQRGSNSGSFNPKSTALPSELTLLCHCLGQFVRNSFLLLILNDSKDAFNQIKLILSISILKRLVRMVIPISMKQLSRHREKEYERGKSQVQTRSLIKCSTQTWNNKREK